MSLILIMYLVHFCRILLTALQPLSKHLCPRCLASHDNLCDARTPEDMLWWAADKCKDSKTVQKQIKCACKQVFEKGHSLKSEKLKALLDYLISPLTQYRYELLSFLVGYLIMLTYLNQQSAFCVCLGDLGVNAYKLFVPDLMHKFEP